MNIKIVIKKVIGILLIAIGFVSLVTPLTPGSWLLFAGLELFGFRLLFWDKIKMWFQKMTLPPASPSRKAGEG